MTWVALLLALLAVVFVAYCIADRLERNQQFVGCYETEGPTCEMCEHWQPEAMSREIFTGHLSGLGACSEPHMVEIYGDMRYVLLLTEAAFRCPKWEHKTDYDWAKEKRFKGENRYA